MNLFSVVKCIYGVLLVGWIFFFLKEQELISMPFFTDINNTGWIETSFI